MENLISLWEFVMSPPVMCAVIWWIVKTYFGKQEALLTKLTEGMAAVNLKIAVHETRAVQLEEGLKELGKLKENQTLIQARMDAAWRAIDKLERRDAEELARLMEKSA